MKRLPAILLLCFTSAGPVWALDPQAIDDLLADVPVRQEQSLLKQLTKTFPGVSTNSSSSLVMWHYIDFAFGAYAMGNSTDWAAADTGLIGLLHDLRTFTDGNGMPYNKTAYADDVDVGHFHWNGYLLGRIYLLYSSQSQFPATQGRMGTAAEDAVLQMLFEWAKTECRNEFANPDTVHISWGSENHDLQQWISYWTANRVLKNVPAYQNQTYDDGSTPIQNAPAFDVYFKKYCQERALKGCTVERGSPTYAKYTLNTLYNLYDFADDPELKEAADMLIDIYYADFMLEMVGDGERGGGHNRQYPGSPAIGGTGPAGHVNVLFGTGSGTAAHPGDMACVTTTWRPSPVTVALFLDHANLGTYSYTSRGLGLKHPNPDPDPTPVPGNPFSYNHLNPDGGSLLRTTLRTPEFVMGMSQVDALPNGDWIAFSSQNRWNGVVFNEAADARIFTQRQSQNTPSRNASETNAEWGIQNKGVMILQRLTTGNQHAIGQGVWLDNDLAVSELSGWIFLVSTDAYAAVRIVDGGYTMVPDNGYITDPGTGDLVLKYPGEPSWHRNPNENLNLGQWADLTDQYSPIIIEVAPKSDYASFTAFRQEMIANANAISWDGTRLDYTSIHYDTTLTLFADESAPPLVDGLPVNLEPAAAYTSPYLNGTFSGGPVIINYRDWRSVHGIAPFADDAATFALWHFDELVAGTDFADDTSVTGRSATDAMVHPDSTDRVSVITDGKFGHAVRCALEAGDQYLMTAGAWPAGVGTFRYRGWFRLQPGDTGGTLFHIYDQVTLNVSTSEVSFSINRSGDVLDASATNQITHTAVIAATNDWQYLEAIYDGDSIRLLTEVETVSAPGIGAFVPDRRNIYVGSRKNRSNYVGEMDEVKVGTFIADPVVVAMVDENLVDLPAANAVTTNTLHQFAPATGANTKLVVAASWEQGTNGIASVTYAGLPFTEAVSSDAGRQSSIWYRDLDGQSPVSGDIVVTFNAATDSRIGALSLQNAAPGAPTQTAAVSAVSTLAISPSVNHSLVVGVYTENGNGSVSSDFVHTLYAGTGGSSVGHAGYQGEALAGMKTYTWTSNNTQSAIAAAVFAPAAYRAPGPIDDDGDGMDDHWEVERLGSLGASNGTSDTDGDAATDLEEYHWGTDPLNAASYPRVSAVLPSALSWLSVQGKRYGVLSTTNLFIPSWDEIASGIPGEAAETTHAVTPSGPREYFRVEVGPW